MFNWSDNGKFPFMGMMNMDNGNNTNPMNFMQQAFMMQMQFMQNMTMMQIQFMENMMNTFNVMQMNSAMSHPEQTPAQEETNASLQKQGGFKLGSMDVPPELLKKFMQMDMSPENLEKLQKALDFAFKES